MKPATVRPSFVGRYNQYNTPGVEGRFWEKVDVREAGACWEWLGARVGMGYGTIRVGGKTVKAHRLSWELCRGPIPVGLHVLHRCDNPPCVNPDHLWIGTNYDNVLDKVRKGRLGRRDGEHNGRTRLTFADVAEIRRRRAAGERRMDLAAEYGLDGTTVGRICQGRSWVCAATSSAFQPLSGTQEAFAL